MYGVPKMNEQYIATVYCRDEKMAVQWGNDVDQLYAWMLLQVNGSFGDIRGEIIDNQTNKIIRTFRKAPIE